MRKAKILATTIAIVGLLTLAPSAAYARTSVGSDYRVASDGCGEHGNHSNSDKSCTDKTKADKDKADKDKAEKADKDKAEADEDASGALDTDNDAEDQAEKAD